MPNFLALEYYPIEREPPWCDLVTVPSLGSFIKDGYFELPTGPGWGVELDEAEIARHPYQEVWSSRVVGTGVAGLTTA